MNLLSMDAENDGAGARVLVSASRRFFNAPFNSWEGWFLTLTRDFVRLSILAALAMIVAVPTLASAAAINYTAAITVTSTTGDSLGYLQDSPDYWTPQTTTTSADALIVTFTLDGTSGTRVNLAPQNLAEPGFPLFGLVQGRDSTSANIGSGNFNYLYLGGVSETAPGATPQTSGNYFSSVSRLTKASESAVWTIDVTTGLLLPVWINSDGSTPTTFIFVQSNHVYAGGDPAAFQSRFPANVTAASLGLEILSAIPQDPASVPEPSSLMLVAGGLTAVITGARRRRTRS